MPRPSRRRSPSSQTRHTAGVLHLCNAPGCRRNITALQQRLVTPPAVHQPQRPEEIMRKRSGVRRIVSTAVAGAALVALAGLTNPVQAAGRYAHVLLISIDGLHAVDLTRFLAQHPDSALAGLAKQGVYYSNATGSKPSDSFPGLLAMVTGGSPASTGVYYDDSYDRTLSAPGSNCSVKGAEIVFDESIDIDPDKMESGGIDPKKLPLDPAHGCKPVWPHSFLRVNT